MDNPLFILGVIVVAGIVFFLLLKKYGGGKKGYLPEGPDIEQRVDDIDDRRVTSNGLNLRVEDIASVTELEIRAIEAGIQDCIAKAQARGWSSPNKLSEFTVAIIGDVARSPEQKIWCYKLPVGAYKDTEWDLGGYILAAGQAIHGTNILIMPDHKGSEMTELPGYPGGDLAQLREIAMFEAEHRIAYLNDMDLYNSTSIHGVGTGHPIF